MSTQSVLNRRAVAARNRFTSCVACSSFGKATGTTGGLCSADSSEDGRTYFVLCTSARGDRELRTVRVQVAVGARTEYLVPYEQYQAVSYSLLPADFGLDPVVRRQ